MSIVLARLLCRYTAISSLFKPKPLRRFRRRAKKIEECIKRASEEEAFERAVKKRKVGKHNTYSPEERASIGKYAAENGATKVAVYFSKKLNIEINESTARKFKNEYERELAFSKEKSKLEGRDDVCKVSKLCLLSLKADRYYWAKN